MEISVALAARNAERYLGELLDSLAAQTAAPAELVFYDDASEDSTPALIAEFARTAPFPVRILRDEVWRGHVEGFMRAARACHGDAIAFCDADDVWLDHKLETCERELAASRATLLLHTTRVVDAELQPLGRNWPEVGTTRTAPPLGLTGLDIDAPGMGMVVRREVLDVADFDARPPSRYGLGRAMLHDEWIIFLAGALGPVRLLDEPLLLYRQHGANDSGGWVDRHRRLSLRPAHDDYRRAAEHTAGCAEYLEHAAAGQSGEAAERFAEGARVYRRAAANWALRVALYDTPGRRRRTRVLLKLVAGRAYSARTVGGFGRVALGKDVAAGLALGAAGGVRDDG